MSKAVTKVAEVTIYDASEKLPPKPKDGIGVMILADTAEGWDILMYDHDDIGYGWEEDDFEVRFTRWAYLGDLDRAKRKKK